MRRTSDRRPSEGSASEGGASAGGASRRTDPAQSAAGARQANVASILVLIAVGVVLHLLRMVLLPFVIAAVLAFLLTPLVDALAARTRWPRALIALIVLLALLALPAGGLVLGIPELGRALARLSANLSGTSAQLLQGIMGSHTLTLGGRTLDASQLAATALSFAQRWLATGAVLRTVLLGGIGALVAAGMSVVILGYLLVDGPRLSAGALWIVPPRHRPFVSRVWRRLAPLLRRYFIGVALVVLYAMFAAYLGLGLVLRLKGALGLAVMTGVLEMLPVVGPFSSALIAGIAALQQAKGASGVIGYALYALALRVSIDQFFNPVVLGQAARVRPVLVIFGLIVAGVLFGVTGVLIAVPALLTIRVVLQELYEGSDSRAPLDAAAPEAGGQAGGAAAATVARDALARSGANRPAR